ncbi:hypothetical protein RISK_002838 [Rhodopirellula islandica]|uniref:Uncharacterized protein n=1 Tax=Rhodopirellula islandica TaxID=595434 RepID=A0A0J1BEZ5_RHOIS|nr:hypothetical protein RISK_002838 [Rhodopirellula islandica]
MQADRKPAPPSASESDGRPTTAKIDVGSLPVIIPCHHIVAKTPAQAISVFFPQSMVRNQQRYSCEPLGRLTDWQCGGDSLE